MCVFRHNHSSDRGECDLSPPSINPSFLSPSTLDLTSTRPPASLYHSLLLPRASSFSVSLFHQPPPQPPFYIHPSFPGSQYPPLRCRPALPFIFHHFIRFISWPPFFFSAVLMSGCGDGGMKRRRNQKRGGRRKGPID